MIEQLKIANHIKYNPEEGIGYYVVEHKLYPIDLSDLDTQELGYIIENGETVSEYDVRTKTKGDIFQYSIHNGGEYEFSEGVRMYSLNFFTFDEFNGMVIEAIDAINKESDEDHLNRDPFRVGRKIKEMHPNVFLEISSGAGACTCQWQCGGCRDPLR